MISLNIFYFNLVRYTYKYKQATQCNLIIMIKSLGFIIGYKYVLANDHFYM